MIINKQKNDMKHLVILIDRVLITLKAIQTVVIDEVLNIFIIQQVI